MPHRQPPYPPNPWIAAECRRFGIAQAPIPTGLQPTFSQCAEDLMLEAHLRADFRRQGRSLSSLIYVDIGANHPVQTSNTYLFYAKHGSSGLLVEANPALLNELTRCRARDRVLHAAVAPRGYSHVRLHIARCHELSSAAPAHLAHFGEPGEVIQTVDIPAICLDDLLTTQFTASPDVLSLDIEGMDLAVIEDARLDRNAPRYIVVEHDRDVVPGNDQRILSRLETLGYRLLGETDVNFLLRLDA